MESRVRVGPDGGERERHTALMERGQKYEKEDKKLGEGSQVCVRPAEMNRTQTHNSPHNDEGVQRTEQESDQRWNTRKKEQVKIDQVKEWKHQLQGVTFQREFP